MNKHNEQGEKHGPWETYDTNGKLWSKANYLNDVLHGPLEWYYPNGKVSIKANYLNGKLHGPREYYYSNGKLDEIEYYIT